MIHVYLLKSDNKLKPLYKSAEWCYKEDGTTKRSWMRLL